MRQQRLKKLVQQPQPQKNGNLPGVWHNIISMTRVMIIVLPASVAWRNPCCRHPQIACLLCLHGMNLSCKGQSKAGPYWLAGKRWAATCSKNNGRHHNR